MLSINTNIDWKWFTSLLKKVAKPYYARYKFDNTIGFFKDANDCPLCPKCLKESTSTPGRYIGKRKMLCPVHGEVDGAESVRDTKVTTINIDKETADEVLIKRKWTGPKGEGIMPISAESIDVIKAQNN